MSVFHVFQNCTKSRKESHMMVGNLGLGPWQKMLSAKNHEKE